MTKSTTEHQWPKAYLVQVMQRAVDEGCIRVHVKSEVEGKSMMAALARIRRRSDKANAMFIRPEFLAISCAYEQTRKTVLVMFNKVPADYGSLPMISSVADKVDIHSNLKPIHDESIDIDLGLGQPEPEENIDFDAMLEELRGQSHD